MFAGGATSRGPREQLLARLAADASITADAVRAIAAVPRERFVPPALTSLAYEDAALEIGPAATISAPSMVAVMLSALALEPWMKVLEVGAGSGYAAATMASLGATVVGVELQPDLAERARSSLEAAGFVDRVSVIAADGEQGWTAEAPYDRVLVSAAVDAVPPSWLEQLAPGGVLVYPEAGPGADTLVRLIREPHGFRREELGACRFVRLQLRER
jgi:protein-L-isoaspartate(D-aspartate) O-methyltransferase